jgi:integrase
MAVLEAMAAIREGEHVFPGGRAGQPISAVTTRAALHQLRRDVTIHGFRSSFTDWAMEKTDFPREARELALGHAVGDRVEEAYRRGAMLEKRFRLAEAWAAFCASPPVERTVVPIRAGAR